MFALVCTVMQQINASDTPELTWLGPNGEITSNGNGITLGDMQTYDSLVNLSIQFNPLAVFHEGVYRCQASIESIDQQTSLEYNLTVARKADCTKHKLKAS